MIEIARDVIVAVAAAATAFAAWRGLSTWRKQMLGGERHRTASSLLRCALRWRNEVRRIRNPVVLRHEMEPLDDEPADWAGTDEHLLGQLRAYTRRLDALNIVRRDLETAAVEAEMYLGEWPREWFSEFLGLEVKLRAAVQEQLRRHSRRPRRRTSQEQEERDEVMRQEMEAVLYAGGSEDSFGQKVGAALSDLKRRTANYLK